jgi:hypothetical protein
MRRARRDRDMTGLITATLATLVAEPERLLTLLESHWPDPKPRGRPPQT